jgi:SAM-dependent methyltransferase
MQVTNAARFERNGEGYARFRPGYPAAMVGRLAGLIKAGPASGPVVDVGCGTGIFTRQLAAALGPGACLIGLEPAAAMRGQAERQDGQGIAYRDGAAENLPLHDLSARAVATASAAHWFDRPAFYREALRVLQPGGALAIIDYIRDVDASAAAAAVEDFLRLHGGPKVYERPDYAAELDAVEGFGAVDAMAENVTVRLTQDELVGLALSSSHARSVIAKLGQAGAEGALREVAASLADAAGEMSYGYVFRMFVTARNGEA